MRAVSCWVKEERETVKGETFREHRTLIAGVTKPGPSGLIPLRRGVVLPSARSLHCRTERRETEERYRPPR